MSRAASFAVAAVASLLLAATALAGAPGRWDPLTDTQQGAASQLGVARTADGVLHVAWQRGAGASPHDLLHTAIARNGRIGATTPIVTGWLRIQDVALVSEGNALSAWFTGQRTTDTFDPFFGLSRATSGDGGVAWSGPASVYRDQNVHRQTPSVAVVGGTTLQSWYEVSQTVIHAGLDPATPVVRFGGPCCSYQQNVVSDGTSAYVAWCGGIDAPNGIFVQPVSASGAPAGAAMQMPGSVGSSNGRPIRVCDASGRVPLVARVGGGFYVAESGGYPSAERVRVWRVGAGAAPIVSTTRGFDLRTVALAAAPDGRLWVAWSRRGTDQLFLRRSNRAVTRFGALVSVRQPGGQVETNELDLAAQADRVDVLARMTAVGAVRVFHSQVYPGLTLTATGGTVARFRVTDAGDPVAGATIRVAGRSATTDALGRATLDLPRGRFTATATKRLYASARATVRTT